MSESSMYAFRNPNLDIESRLDDLLGRLTLEEKIKLMPTSQVAIERLDINEFIVGGEAAHGLAWLGEATSFPQPIGMACSWDPNLMKEIGTAIGKEARVYYEKLNKRQGLTLWAPTIDLERDPRWGRTEEGYGEDPYLTGILARMLVEGMQGDHPFYKRTVSTIKHYIGNNNEKDRLTSSSNIDNRNKYEYYTKPFQYVIQNKGAYSLMPAYNSVNGLPCIIDPDLNRLVKKDWGLNGYIVGDAGDMKMLVDFHEYCLTYSKAVSLTIKSGVDSINDEVELVVSSIWEAIHEGLLKETDLNNALRNIFRTRIQLGEFDPINLNPFSNISGEVLCCTDHNKLSLKASKESIVLLKNSNSLLPLNRTNINTLAVIGPLSDVLHRDWYSGCFPYTVTPLQGIRNKFQNNQVEYHSGNDYIAIRSKKTGKYLTVDSYDGNRIKATSSLVDESSIFEVTDWGWGKLTLLSVSNQKFVTINGNSLEATANEPRGWFVREIFNITEIINTYWSKILTWNNKTVTISGASMEMVTMGNEETTNDESEYFEICLISSGKEEAKKIASSADAVIVFVGNHPLINGKEDQDRPDISLPQYQEELIKELYQINKKVIVFTVGSYPFSICEINKLVPAILYSSHGSQELGNAISEVLCGDYSPSGRLPMTWYKSLDQISDIMDYDIIKGERTYLYFTGEPLYPFGYGLTYSTFEYSDMKLSSETVFVQDLLVVSCEIQNIGNFASDEVVQVYVNSNNSIVKRPIKELRGFNRVHLKSGEKIQLKFKLDIKDFAFWDVTREKYCVESGTYSIMVGSSSQDIRLTQNIKVIGDSIPKRDLKILTKAENYDDYHNVLINKSEDGEQCIHSISEDTWAWVMFNNIDNLFDCDFQVEVLSTNSFGEIEVRGNDPFGELIGREFIGSTDDWTNVTFRLITNGNIERIYIRFNKNVKIKKFRIKL